MTMRIALASDASAAMNIINTGYAQLRALANTPYTSSNLLDWTLAQTTAQIANPQTTFAVSLSGTTVLGVLQARTVGAVFGGVQYEKTAEALQWFVLPASTQATTRTRFRTVSKEMLANYYQRARAQNCVWVWGRLPSTLPTLTNELITNMVTARPKIILDRASEPGFVIFRGSPDDGDAGLAGVT